MILKIFVECLCNYKFIVRLTNGLELYNTLIINELIENSEENLIKCAYWFHLLNDKDIHIYAKEINKFTIQKLNAPHLEELYEK